MASNPFYVDPTAGGDPGRAMAGLGQALMQVGEQRRAQEAEEKAVEARQQMQADIMSAYESGDADQMARAAIQYPQMSDLMYKQIGVNSDKQKAEMSGFARDVITSSPDQVERKFQERISSLKAQGRDASDTEQQYMDWKQNPEGEMQDLKAFYAGLDPKGYAALKDMEPVEVKAASIGTYNPRDYTVESFAKFTKSGKPEDLERYTEKTIMVGDVPHMLNPSTKKYEPLKTASEIGKDKAEIESAVTEAREIAKSEAAKIVSQQGQFNKLEQADSVYNTLKGADLSKIYGFAESMYPDFLRSPEGAGLVAQRDQLVGMLTLAARGELKGQGPITESEQGMLAKAATILSNENIPADLAKSELDSAMKILYQSAGQEFDPMQKPGAMMENPTQAEYDQLSVGDEYMYNGKRYRKK